MQFRLAGTDTFGTHYIGRQAPAIQQICGVVWRASDAALMTYNNCNSARARRATDIRTALSFRDSRGCGHATSTAPWIARTRRVSLRLFGNCGSPVRRRRAPRRIIGRGAQTSQDRSKWSSHRKLTLRRSFERHLGKLEKLPPHRNLRLPNRLNVDGCTLPLLAAAELANGVNWNGMFTCDCCCHRRHAVVRSLRGRTG
jgi:hypothetical protein